MKTETSIGLKDLRNNPETINGKPKYHCDNCKCNRYSKCTCTRKEKK